MKKALLVVIFILFAALYIGGCGNSQSEIDNAYESGYEDAEEQMLFEIEDAYNRGHDAGFDAGFNAGHEDGYSEGLSDAVRWYDIESQEYAYECPNCGITIVVDRFDEGVINDYYW